MSQNPPEDIPGSAGGAPGGPAYGGQPWPQAQPYGQPGQPGQPGQQYPPPGQGYQPPPGQGYQPPPGQGYQPPPGQGYQPPGAGYQQPGFPGYQGQVQGAPVAGYGPGGPMQQDDKAWAMIAYLGTIVVSFLAPLIAYFAKKDQSPFVRYHAAQSLNLMITSTIYGIGLFVVAIVLGAVTHGLGFLLFFLLWLALGIVVLVYLFIAAIAANRGELYKLPPWLALHIVH
jgi:uncharacterized protein